MFKKFIKSTAAALALLAVSALPAHAAQYEMSATSMMMTTHPVVASAVIPMLELIKERSGGKLEITMYNAGTLVPDAELYPSTERGIVDMALFFPPRTPHLFPILVLGDYPFLFTSSRAAGFSLNALYDNNPELQNELQKIHVLSFASSTPKDLVSIKPIRSLEDLQGKRIGVLDAASSEVIALLGGTAITMPLADMYMGLQRGMLDAVLAPIPTYRSTKVCEVGKYITKCNVSVSAAPFFMNKKSHDKLPAEVKKVVDDISGFPFTALHCNWVEKSTEADLKYLMENDKVQVIALSPEESARWAAKTEPMYEKWKENARKAGVKDPDAILKELQGYAKKFNAVEAQKAETAKYKDILGKLYMEF